MKHNLYSGHVPTSLYLLRVDLADGEIVCTLAHQEGVEFDCSTIEKTLIIAMPDSPPLERLDYTIYLLGVVRERLKRVLKVEEEPIPKLTVKEPAHIGIPITADNVGDLPDNLRSETRRRIFAQLGIDDDKSPEC